MAYDGKVIIEVELTTDKLRNQLNQLKNSFADLGDIGSIFGNLGSTVDNFGSTFKALKGVIGPTAAGIVATITTIITAFDKLYEASKQNFFDNIKNISNTLQPAINTIKSFGNEILNTFTQITGFEMSFSSLLTSAIQFEESMYITSSVMKVTKEGIEDVSNRVLDLAVNTRYSASQISDSMYYMGLAGWSVEESFKSVENILDVVAASGENLSRVSDIVTDNITALGMSANQAGDFCDYLIAAVTSSNTNVSQFGDAMTYVGSVAGSLGIEMNDLSVAVSLLADSGIKSSKAGTALRRLLSNLASPTDTVAKAMQKYGIELITAADGSVDLDATLRNLRKSLGSLPLVEQAAAAKALAGQTGFNGLLAIVNATDERFDQLTNTISNSTQHVAFWNEILAQSGVIGDEAKKKIEMLKEAYDGASDSANALNLTSNDLALAVQILGDDSKVTSSNVNELLNVFMALQSPTKKQASTMEQLGLTYRTVDDDIFNLSNTITALKSSSIGLSDEQLKNLSSMLEGCKTIEEANEVISRALFIWGFAGDQAEISTKQLEEWGVAAQSSSTGQIDMIENLKELRKAFSGLSDEQIKNKLKTMGLGDSYQEIKEVLSMTDEEFESYCNTLEKAEGLSTELADLINTDTAASFDYLYSVIESVSFKILGDFINSLKSGADALQDFFEIWYNQEGGGPNMESFNLGLDSLLESIKNADITGAIGSAIDTSLSFIKGGSLGKILDIGTEIIHQICQGIIKNKKSISEGISSAIKQIADFVKTVAPEIEEAGKVILESIKSGIENNTQDIHQALEAVADAMNSWISTSESIKALTGNFADIFISSLIENIKARTIGKAVEFWNAIKSGLMNSQPDFSKGSTGFMQKILGWFTGESYADEKTGNEKPLSIGKSNTKSSSKSNNTSNVLSSMSSKEIQTLNSELLKLQTTSQTVSNMVSSSFTSMQNTIRSSLVGCANIARNQFVSMANIVRNQSLNCSNIVRNQFISISNVVRNQSLNARNSLTTQFISMRKVATTQATATRNVITSQFISIRKVVTTQSRVARNSFTSQMISMRKVASTQSKLIGQQLANGITQGLKNGTQSAVNAARDLVNQVNAEMKKTAKINSPSKVTTGYGENLDEGLIVGMKNKAKEVNDHARNLINSLNSEMLRSLNNMAKGTVLSSQISATKIATEVNNKISVQHNMGKGSMQELAKVVKDAVKDVQVTVEESNSKPLYAELTMDKTKMASALAKPIDERNKITEKRLNRLEGVTNV